MNHLPLSFSYFGFLNSSDFQKSYFYREIYGNVVVELAEQAQLFLLKNRLRKIRRDRRNATILSLAIAFIVAFILQQYWSDFITGFILWGGIGVLFALTVIRYYNAQEAQVLWQIEQIAKGSSSTEL